MNNRHARWVALALAALIVFFGEMRLIQALREEGVGPARYALM